LTISLPQLSIDTTVANEDPNSGWSVISSLSDQIDEGIVRFQRYRNNIRTNLVNTINPSTNPTDYLLDLNQTVITGGYFNQTQQIEFFMPDNSFL
jgi:hypothetical protein